MVFGWAIFIFEFFFSSLDFEQRFQNCTYLLEMYYVLYISSNFCDPQKLFNVCFSSVSLYRINFPFSREYVTVLIIIFITLTYLRLVMRASHSLLLDSWVNWNMDVAQCKLPQSGECWHTMSYLYRFKIGCHVWLSYTFAIIGRRTEYLRQKCFSC